MAGRERHRHPDNPTELLVAWAMALERNRE